jgi:integrase
VALCSARTWSIEHRKGVRTSLNQFFDWALQEGIVEHNPAAKLPRIESPTPRPRPAPDDVWFDLIAAAPPRERLMALLAGEAGLRRAEVAALHSDDLIQDLLGSSLIIHGKGGRQRVVPLNSALASELRQLITRRGHLFPGIRKCDHHRGACEGHITPEWVGTVISNLMPPGWTMHKLRHRFATLGYAGTGNLRAVQEALGHASVATTQRYTAVSSRDVRSVSEAAASVVRTVVRDGNAA